MHTWNLISLGYDNSSLALSSCILLIFVVDVVGGLWLDILDGYVCYSEFHKPVAYSNVDMDLITGQADVLCFLILYPFPFRWNGVKNICVPNRYWSILCCLYEHMRLLYKKF